MREAMGGIPIFEIVIVFILLFTGIMCLTINRAKAYGVKDEIITLIETEAKRTNGSSFELSSSLNEKIAEELSKVGYRVTGKCPEDNEDNRYVGYDRNGVKTTRDAAYCIRYNRVDNIFYNDVKDKCKNSKCIPTVDDFPTMLYYDVVLFYQLDIPLVKDAFNFKVSGSTRVLFE